MKLETVDYSELTFADQHLVRKRVRCVGGQDHSRSVYRGPRLAAQVEGSSLLYKVWNPTYARRGNILDGLESGFYDSTTAPALVALSFEGPVCRGYVMEECTTYGKVPRAFYERVKEKTAQTGRFHYDLTGCNIMRFGDRYSRRTAARAYVVRAASAAIRAGMSQGRLRQKSSFRVTLE